MMKKKPMPYQGKETKKEEMAEMRKPMGYKNGGLVQGSAPNAPTGVCGPGVRGPQDYRK